MLNTKTKSYLWWLHIQYFGDPSLHDKKMRIIDVKWDRLEQICYFLISSWRAIDHVFVSSTNYNLW